jgi:isopentenyl-diphosphate delta-isomerase
MKGSQKRGKRIGAKQAVAAKGEFPIGERKFDHVRISIEENVSSTHNFWDDVVLEHLALPEINFEDISLKTKLFGRPISAPLVISGMTGGHHKLTKINQNLAFAAEKLGIPMGVGSQRAALESPELRETFAVIKGFDIPVRIANIGAPQLVLQRKGNRKPLTVDDCKKLMEMIDAHVLAIHLNFLQEAVQMEGEKNAVGVIDRIKDISSELPVIVKETGAGISFPVARRLASKTKIIGIDVGGLSGTSFSAVEALRSAQYDDPMGARLGRMLWDWGVPTPISVVNASCAGIQEIIATGGIRSGLDVARALVLGARCAGLARQLLPRAVTSGEGVQAELEAVCHELRTVMHLTGARIVDDLPRIGFSLVGSTGELFSAGAVRRGG